MSRDHELIDFLKWATPRLGLRWRGFRRVRGQVGKRLRRRLAALGIGDLAAYRRWLAAHPDEWAVLDGLCRVTISRFLRDRGLFERLGRQVLPELAAGRSTLRAWSAGCARGEEPYSLVLLWRALDPAPGVTLEVVATDADPRQLERARRGAYARATLRELPGPWIAGAFEQRDGLHVLRPRLRAAVQFVARDVRQEAPAGPFQLVLCRNLALTYFDEPVQRGVLARIARVLEPGGALVVGAHEQLPADAPGFAPWQAGKELPLYRRLAQ